MTFLDGCLATGILVARAQRGRRALVGRPGRGGAGGRVLRPWAVANWHEAR